MVIERYAAAGDTKTPVRGYLHIPDHPYREGPGAGLVLTHGAGANCEATLLISLATAFCRAGWAVLRCDLPFRQLRPHGPPPPGSAEDDQQGLKAAVMSLRQALAERNGVEHSSVSSSRPSALPSALRNLAPRIFLAGHSYGGRQASLLAAAEPDLVEALLLLAYPLHPPKRPAQLRTAHFPKLRAPSLFVSGSRDGFGSLHELSNALKLIPAKTALCRVESAGHQLLTRNNCGQLPELIVKEFLQLTGAAG